MYVCMYVCMHAFIPFMHGPTKYDYSRIRDIHIQSRDASLEHHTKSHPNTLQLYISPAGGGCFPHSRRILGAVELASAGRFRPRYAALALMDAKMQKMNTSTSATSGLANLAKSFLAEAPNPLQCCSGQHQRPHISAIPILEIDLVP